VAELIIEAVRSEQNLEITYYSTGFLGTKKQSNKSAECQIIGNMGGRCGAADIATMFFPSILSRFSCLPRVGKI
jgi:hypothetical protein